MSTQELFPSGVTMPTPDLGEKIKTGLGEDMCAFHVRIDGSV